MIAFSPIDASRVFAEHIGEPHDDARHPWRDVTEAWPVVDEEFEPINCTPAEFIADHGRGFLCSEDR